MLAGACAIAWATEESQLYTLDYPGVVFEWLPPEMASPVAGTLEVESGSVASPPSTSGTEYHFFYWQEAIPLGEGQVSWLDTRLPSVLPAGFGDNLQVGDPTWVEGSQLSQYRNGRSLGLVLRVNFNVIDEDGNVLGIGRAYSAFRNGYSVLMYCLSPAASAQQAVMSMDAIVAQAHLTE
jgi:hypothetical protein